MKKMFLTVIALLTVGTLSAHAAQNSGVLLQLAPMYQHTSTTSGGSTSGSSTLSSDVSFGYVMQSQWALGVRYTFSNSSIDPGGSSSGVTYLGPMGGYYFDNGMYMLLAYLYQVSVKSGSNEIKGDGFQFDVGYIYRGWGNFGFGPQLTYQQLNYKKSVSGSTETDIDQKTTRYWVPSFVLGWIFN